MKDAGAAAFIGWFEDTKDGAPVDFAIARILAKEMYAAMERERVRSSTPRSAPEGL